MIFKREVRQLVGRAGSLDHLKKIYSPVAKVNL